VELVLPTDLSEKYIDRIFSSATSIVVEQYESWIAPTIRQNHSSTLLVLDTEEQEVLQASTPNALDMLHRRRARIGEIASVQSRWILTSRRLMLLEAAIEHVGGL
jgi:hypothetical protein